MSNVEEGSAWVMDLRGTDPSALSGVRRWATRTAPHLGTDHLNDMLMVIDELVANAYVHGGGPMRARITALRTPCRVVIEVDDHCPAHPLLSVSQPAHFGASGLGMFLINELADTWGVHELHETPESRSKTVWARLSCGNQTRSPCR